MTNRFEAAYLRGLQAREKISELMRAPDYWQNSLKQEQVRQIFATAYPGQQPGAPTGPGQAAADPFSRYG